MKIRQSRAAQISILGLLTCGVSPALAQGPNLAGKTVQVIIGFGTGGGYDLWGRSVARHLGKHLPGKPTVVPQNMPGAGSLNAANHIFNVAPKDGTAVALISGDAAVGPLTGAAGAHYDPLKFTWVGTPWADTSICVAFNSPRAKVKTLKDLYEHELVVGSAGVGISAYTFPKALSALLGMKFKVILGFPASSDILLAMERGELDGFCPSLDSISNLRPDWIPNKKITILFQGGAAPNPAIQDVPFILDLAKAPDDRAAIEFLYLSLGLGRPFIAPPGIPAERVTMLQDAFMATMSDPDFIADTRKQKLEIDARDGSYLAALIRKIYATPKPIIEKVAGLIN